MFRREDAGERVPGRQLPAEYPPLHLVDIRHRKLFAIAIARSLCYQRGYSSRYTLARLRIEHVHQITGGAFKF